MHTRHGWEIALAAMAVAFSAMTSEGQSRPMRGGEPEVRPFRFPGRGQTFRSSAEDAAGKTPGATGAEFPMSGAEEIPRHRIGSPGMGQPSSRFAPSSVPGVGGRVGMHPSATAAGPSVETLGGAEAALRRGVFVPSPSVSGGGLAVAGDVIDYFEIENEQVAMFRDIYAGISPYFIPEEYEAIMKRVDASMAARFGDGSVSGMWIPHRASTVVGSLQRVAKVWGAAEDIRSLAKIGVVTGRGVLEGKETGEIIDDLVASGVGNSSVFGEAAYWATAIGTGMYNGRSFSEAVSDAFDPDTAGTWAKTGWGLGYWAAEGVAGFERWMNRNERRKLEETMLSNLHEAGYGEEAEAALRAWLALDTEARIRTPFVFKEEWKTGESEPRPERGTPLGDLDGGPQPGETADETPEGESPPPVAVGTEFSRRPTLPMQSENPGRPLSVSAETPPQPGNGGRPFVSEAFPGRTSGGGTPFTGGAGRPAGQTETGPVGFHVKRVAAEDADLLVWLSQTESTIPPDSNFGFASMSVRLTNRTRYHIERCIVYFDLGLGQDLDFEDIPPGGEREVSTMLVGSSVEGLEKPQGFLFPSLILVRSPDGKGVIDLYQTGETPSIGYLSMQE